MFTGADGAGGERIEGINLRLFAQGDSWVPAGNDFPAGTLRRDYSVEMIVTFVGGDTATVNGIQNFFVLNVGTESEPEFQLRHWRDTGRLNGFQANEAASWGAVRSIF